MKKLLYILTILSLLCSCEHKFELGADDVPDKLYVSCIVNEEGTACLNVETAVSVSKISKNHTPLELDKLVFKVNGKERKLQKAEYDPAIWGSDLYLGLNIWVAEGKVNPEDRIEISADSKTAEEVSGSSVMPSAVSIRNFEWKPVVLKDVLDRDTVRVIRYGVEIDNPDEECFYGVKVMYEYQDTVYVDDEEPEIFEYRTYMDVGDFKNSAGNIDDVLNDISGNAGTWMLSYYNDYSVMRYANRSGLFMTSGKNFSDGKISFQTSYQPSYDRKYTSTNYYFDEEKEDWLPKEVNVHYIHHGRYRVTIYRISKEFYLYNKAIYILDNDILSELGLSTTSYSYSNIEGGFGLIGGITASEEISFMPFED